MSWWGAEDGARMRNPVEDMAQAYGAISPTASLKF